MPNVAFRIDSVSIEGFKAFTTQQSFSFEGRNVFLFGQNGMGKTSIVEAIRWCLFGLASRPGEIVKNQFYGGPCVVQLRLQGPEGIWGMQRRLRPSGGESDLTIRDPDNIEQNIQEVFPQLSRIGPMEGTHVIYAPQQPSSRRPEADITDFSYVVYRYLGVEDVPRMSDLLLDLSKDWEVQESNIDESVSELQEKIMQSIADVDERLSRFTSSPPWGATITPTNAHTRSKIDLLIRDAENVGVQLSADDLAELSPRDKLYEVHTAVNAFLSEGVGGANLALLERANRLQQGLSLLEIAEETSGQIQLKSDNALSIHKALEGGLQGSQLEQLQDRRKNLQNELDAENLKLDIVRSSIRYLEVVGQKEGHAMCPACDTGYAAGELVGILQESEATIDVRRDDFLFLLSH